MTNTPTQIIIERRCESTPKVVNKTLKIRDRIGGTENRHAITFGGLDGAFLKARPQANQVTMAGIPYRVLATRQLPLR